MYLIVGMSAQPGKIKSSGPWTWDVYLFKSAYFSPMMFCQFQSVSFILSKFFKNFHLKKFYWTQLIYNAVLVSGVQPRELSYAYTYVHSSRFFCPYGPVLSNFLQHLSSPYFVKQAYKGSWLFLCSPFPTPPCPPSVTNTVLLITTANPSLSTCPALLL